MKILLNDTIDKMNPNTTEVNDVDVSTLINNALNHTTNTTEVNNVDVSTLINNVLNHTTDDTGLSTSAIIFIAILSVVILGILIFFLLKKYKVFQKCRKDNNV